MKLLVDTSALLALVLRNDQHHEAAVRFLRSRPGARYVLTDLILAELITLVRARAGSRRAAAVARELLRSRRYEVVFVDVEIVEGALGQLERFADKQLSFADSASFEIMARFGIEAAFTFDRDFRDCGLRAVP